MHNPSHINQLRPDPWYNRSIELVVVADYWHAGASVHVPDFVIRKV